MRLLSSKPGGGFELTAFRDDKLPPYAILSHTWFADGEVSYRDLVSGAGENKRGYKKLLFCAERAAIDGFRYFWVDTCCIDISNSQEFQGAINSMFRWYRRASKCYAYLSDVSVMDEVVHPLTAQTNWIKAFRVSRWFTRGWTLQELLAPPVVEFFSSDGKLLGCKGSLEQEVHNITKIPISALRGQLPLLKFSISERMSWAANRQTTYEEDKVYCLLGIFDVFLPLIYGEGEEHASRRLKEEIQRRFQPNAPSRNLLRVFHRRSRKYEVMAA